MSTISAIGSAGSAWTDLSSSRMSAMKDKMFAKVDKDGSGSVDKTELQGMLDKISERSGNSLGSAEDVFGKMDGNSDGSLSKDELDAGMKSLMPAPSSTVDFSKQRDGGPSAAPGGPPPTEGSASSGSNSGTDPLDTNGDGTVSEQERAAGAVKDLLKNLLSAIDSDGDKNITKGEVDTFKSQLDSVFSSLQSSSSSSNSSSESDSSSSARRQADLSLSFANQMLKQYGQAAANYSQASTFRLAA